ncbi:MAG: ABC transporter permease subunit [Firmicutes bacterium]|nr:ABC transporter permease subunit [Bacillota bacterium]
MAQSPFSYQFNSVKTVARREFTSIFYGIGVYLALALAFVVSSLIVMGYTGAVVDAGLVVIPDPMMSPLYIILLVSTVYLGLSATVSISRERERGTMEVLFYGPVDGASYVMGKYLEHMAAFVVMGLASLVFLGLASSITRFSLTAGVLKGLVLSIFMASCMISFGIFLSAVTGKMRNSILLFILVMAAFAGFSMLEGYLLSFQGDLSAPLEYARSFVAWLAHGIGWVSPLSYLSRGIDAARVGDVRQLLINIISPVLYSGILLWLSMIAFERKGVRR